MKATKANGTMMRTALWLCISLAISATSLHASDSLRISVSPAFWYGTRGGSADASQGPREGSSSEKAASENDAQYRAPRRTEYTRPKAIRVKTIDEVVDLILEGQVVEVPDTRSVNTLLTKLADMAEEAKKLGKDAPTYDLCNVTVPGTNIFCADKLRSEKYPEGVPRIEMPQLGGEPIPGTEADALPRNPWDPKEVSMARAPCRSSSSDPRQRSTCSAQQVLPTAGGGRGANG